MKILIIGGKRFVGYHIAKEALKKGHEVVFFNRGRTNKELFSDCENLIGDRNSDMNKVKGMKFDYVIDTCAYFPSQVKKALDALEDNYDKYLLISTLSVVKPYTFHYDESVDLYEADYTSEDITTSTYGPLKVACEEVLMKKVKDKGIIIRPGYIVGDKDYTDRFTYLPIMMHFFDKVMVPKTNNLRYSFVDGKDLGAFCIHALETNLGGVFHTVGPDEFYYHEYVELCKKVVNPDCSLVEVDDVWFTKNNKIKGIVFPTCNDNEEGNNIFSANTSKARKNGFKTRSVEDSIKDGLEYFLREKGSIEELKVGLNYKEMQEHLKNIK